MNNVNDGEIIKYLSLIYALNGDMNQKVNLSLYNFYSQSFDLIDSIIASTSVYKNELSVISSEYFNATYHVVLKVQAVNATSEFEYLFDQLMIEFYSAEVAESDYFEHESIPNQPSDFNIIGDTPWEGTLEAQDNDYTSFMGNQGLYIKKITIDHDKVDGSLTDYPLMISLTDSDLASKAQNDGDDIFFTQSDGVSQLDHEIEYFDGSTGELVVWVRIPSLSSSSDTEIYMLYGDPDCGSQENPEGVYDSYFRMVQHLEETSGTHYDPTSNDNDGTANNGVTQVNCFFSLIY